MATTPAAVHVLEQDLQDSKAAKAAQLKSKKLLQVCGRSDAYQGSSLVVILSTGTFCSDPQDIRYVSIAHELLLLCLTLE